MCKVAFYKGNRWHDPIAFLTDNAIRLWTFSKYSHCEIIAVDRFGVELSYSSSARDGGVRYKEIDYDLEKWDVFELKGLEETPMGFMFLNEQLGKGYDFKGIFLTQFINFNRHNVNRWFCSEICHQFCVRAGLKSPKPSHQYSPKRLYKWLKEIGAITP